MATKLPMAWFPDRYMATIRMKRVDKWARFYASINPYFDTWDEANNWLRCRLLDELEGTLKDADRCRRKLTKAISLEKPHAA